MAPTSDFVFSRLHALEELHDREADQGGRRAHPRHQRWIRRVTRSISADLTLTLRLLSQQLASDACQMCLHLKHDLYVAARFPESASTSPPYLFGLNGKTQK